MSSIVRIEEVSFLNRPSGRLLTTHPVVRIEKPFERVQSVGLFPRTRSNGHVGIRLVVRRLDRGLKKVRLLGRRAPGTAPIGDVPEIEVSFRTGAVVTITASARHWLPKARMGRHRVTWAWFVRSEGRLKPAGFSTVTVYTTPALPNHPWGRQSSNQTAIPWIEALDLACRWAKGSRTVPEANAAITRALYGRHDFKYQLFTSVFTKTSAVAGKRKQYFFRCDEFIESLKKNASQKILGCSDTSSIVCTFANLIGGDLGEDKMAIGDGKRLSRSGTTSLVKPIGWKSPK